MHILDKIVKHKKKEVAEAKIKHPIKVLNQSDYYHRTCNSYVQILEKEHSSGVIAEYKRKSPSRSDINLDADLLSVTKGYVSGGADAISILTDQYFFGGDNHFLTSTRQSLPSTPLLRKEFIIDEYQVIQSKAIGADIILLISEILTKDEVLGLSRLARSLGMEVLLEMHSADQLDKYCDYVSMVGINNRDLKTFEVDIDQSKRLFDQLPVNIPKIAESGLQKPSTCVMLYKYGFRGFLIGEQFMKQNDPGQACHTFVNDFITQRSLQ